MPKPAKVSDDKLIMAVRKALQSIEPRKMPTETATNDWGHKCWVCPYCGALIGRKDRTVYRRRVQTTIIDYGKYNMHFGAMHATPFWKEQKLIKLIKGSND